MAHARDPATSAAKPAIFVSNMLASTTIAALAASLWTAAASTGLNDLPVVGDSFQSLVGETWIAASPALTVGGIVPGDLLTDLQRAGEY
jgi:hypothetical protein